MNDGKSNEQMWLECGELFEASEFLKLFRSHIIENNLGYGENEFCVLWEKIICSLKNEFSFLEIGVYKGQILCLASLLAKKYNLESKIYGISPLRPVGDSTTEYDDSDYRSDIVNLHYYFGVDFDINKQIIKGLSTDPLIKKQIRKIAPFDIVYIDGGHNYATAVSDIKLAKKICKNNGLIVTDDASYWKDFGSLDFLFRGHKSVSKAVKNFLEQDHQYTEEYCVGHLRAFRKNENKNSLH